mmetsp:Transcript_17534/g.38877  ORF Transcript_17534/g.38877 Transcript_17534/m.38877 type:complete len:266 (+) Transcript_17534:107-904(+)
MSSTRKRMRPLSSMAQVSEDDDSPSELQLDTLISIPSKIDSSIPRSGKWTAEEETFANRLIEAFEGGSLVDCDDGSTLRSYLAKKLNCAPMRISKKFAGLCIGKHQFAKRGGSDADKSSTKWSQGHDGCVEISQQGGVLISDPLKIHKSKRISSSGSSSSSSTVLGDTSVGSSSGSSSSSSSVWGDTSEFLDMHDIYYNADALSGTIESSYGSSEHLDVEAEQWRDVLSFFCGSLSVSAEQLDMNMVRRDSSFLVKSNSYSSLLL